MLALVVAGVVAAQLDGGAAAQTARDREELDAVLQSDAASVCRRRPTVDCLVDVAVAAAPHTARPWLVARGLAGAGRFGEAFAASATDPDRGTDEPLEIAVLQVEETARARPEVAADLSGIERLAARAANPDQALGIYFYMAGAELLGEGYRGYTLDSAIVSARGRRVLPPVPVPRATVEAILARLRRGPASWFALKLSRGLADRAGAVRQVAEMEAAKPAGPETEAELWAEAGDAGRVRAIEDGQAPPRASVFLDLAESMRAYGDGPVAIVAVLGRAAALSIGEDASEYNPLVPVVFRRVVDMARDVGGREAAAGVVGVGVEGVGGLSEAKRLAAWVMIAVCELDDGDGVAARRVVEERVPMGSATPRLAVLAFRLGLEGRFTAILGSMGYEERREVWAALLRERDVEPTDGFVARCLEGLEFWRRSAMLIDIGLRYLEAGLKERVAEVVREVVPIEREMLGNTGFDMGDGEMLAAAGRLAWAVGDVEGARLVVRTMVEAAFESGDRAAAQLAAVASFWHRRVPGLAF